MGDAERDIVGESHKRRERNKGEGEGGEARMKKGREGESKDRKNQRQRVRKCSLQARPRREEGGEGRRTCNLGLAFDEESSQNLTTTRLSVGLVSSSLACMRQSSQMVLERMAHHIGTCDGLRRRQKLGKHTTSAEWRWAPVYHPMDKTRTSARHEQAIVYVPEQQQQGR